VLREADCVKKWSGEARVAPESSRKWRRQWSSEMKKKAFSGCLAARGGLQEEGSGGDEGPGCSGPFYRRGEAVPAASRRRHGGGRHYCAVEAVAVGGVSQRGR
jgi:hypothetical protein